MLFLVTQCNKSINKIGSVERGKLESWREFKQFSVRSPTQTPLNYEVMLTLTRACELTPTGFNVS